MKGPVRPIKWNVRSSDYTVRSEQFGLPIGYGVGLPLMQPKLTSILERLEKAPDLLSRRTWPRPYALTRAQLRCSKKQG